jgi:hypothetical protein
MQHSSLRNLGPPRSTYVMAQAGKKGHPSPTTQNSHRAPMMTSLGHWLRCKAIGAQEASDTDMGLARKKWLGGILSGVPYDVIVLHFCYLLSETATRSKSSLAAIMVPNRVPNDFFSFCITVATVGRNSAP